MNCITWRPSKVQISLPVPDFSWLYTNPIWVQLMNTHGKYTKTWHSTWPFQIDQACLVNLNPWPVFNAFFYQIKNNFQMCQQKLCRIYQTWTMDKADNIVSAFKVLFYHLMGTIHTRALGSSRCMEFGLVSIVKL